MTLRSFLLSAVSALSVFAVTYQPAAAAATSYTVQGNVYRVVDYVSADADNIRVSTVVKGAAANETYAARVVPLRVSKFSGWFKPQLGALIRGNAWWAAFAGTIATAGWAIDELRNEVVSTTPYGVAGHAWHPENFPDASYTTADEAILDYCANLIKRKNCEIVSRSVIESDSLGASKIQFTYRAVGGVSFWVVYRTACAEGMVASSCQEGFSGRKPIPDVDVNSAVVAQLAADPAYAATAFTDPATGRAYDELFDPVPYIPGLSAADEALVNCYISGHLQTVNSQTACFVATQAEFDRVKQQAEALAAGRTPEASADALNSQMKQPITQAEYEQTNQKYSDAVAAVTAALGSQAESDVSEIEDHFNELDGIITDLPNTALPAPAHMTVPQYVDCKQIHLSDGNGHELDFPSPSQCAKIEIFKQGFGYFLAISVAFLLSMQLLTRPHG